MICRSLIVLVCAALLLPLAAERAAGARTDERSTGRPRAELHGEDVLLARLDLREVEVRHALRLLSELCGLNVAATGEAGRRRVDAVFTNLTAREALDSICKLAQLWYHRDVETRSIRVLTTDEYRRDQVVYLREELRTFTLRHPNVISVAGAIEDLFGERVNLSFGIDESLFGGGLGGFGLGGGLGGLGVGSGFQGGMLGGLGGLGGAGGIGGSGGFGGLGGQLGGMGPGAQGPYGGFARSSGAGGRFGRQVGGAGAELPRDQLGEWTSAQIARAEHLTDESGALDAAAVPEGWRRPAPIHVTVNRMHNLIVVRTSDQEALAEISSLVADLDRPMPQVLLEVQILELEAGEGFRSVFDVGFGEGPASAGPPDGQPPNPLLPEAPSAPRSLLSGLQAPFEGGSFVYQFVDDRVRARIQLLEQQNRLKVVARPLLLTANDRPARLFVGEERVLVTGVQTDVVTPATGATSALVQPVTEVRDVGNSLVLVPRINADRTVTLSLSQDSSSVNPQSSTIPVVSASGAVTAFAIDTVLTATLQATVVAKDGLTLAVGGLIRSESMDSTVKVPLLGDLPLLGKLFRREVRQARESELLLLITPHVLFTPEEAAHWSDPLSRAGEDDGIPGDPTRAPWRSSAEAGTGGSR